MICERLIRRRHTRSEREESEEKINEKKMGKQNWTVKFCICVGLLKRIKTSEENHVCVCARFVCNYLSNFVAHLKWPISITMHWNGSAQKSVPRNGHIRSTEILRVFGIRINLMVCFRFAKRRKNHFVFCVRAACLETRQLTKFNWDNLGQHAEASPFGFTECVLTAEPRKRHSDGKKVKRTRASCSCGWAFHVNDVKNRWNCYENLNTTVTMKENRIFSVFFFIFFCYRSLDGGKLELYARELNACTRENISNEREAILE